MRYRDIIKNSWDIAFKNKWLWVWGALVSMSSNTSFQRISDSVKNIDTKDIPLDLPQKTSQVLGAATSQLMQGLSAVSVGMWGLLALAIVMIVLVFIVANMILQAWAHASLISGVEMAQQGKPVTLSNSSHVGLSRTKSLFYYNIYSGIVIFVGIFGLFLLILLAALIASALKAGWVAAVVILLVVVAFLLGVILVMLSINFGMRLVVLQNILPKDAFWQGIRLVRENLGMTFMISLVNAVFGFLISLVMGLVVLVPAGIVSVPAIIALIQQSEFNATSIGSLVIGIVLAVVVAGTIGVAIQGFSAAFAASNWNYAFKEVYKEEDNDE